MFLRWVLLTYSCNREIRVQGRNMFEIKGVLVILYVKLAYYLYIIYTL